MIIKRTVFGRVLSIGGILLFLLIPSLISAQETTDRFSESRIAVDTGDHYLNLGQIYARKGNHHKALKLYEKAISFYSGLGQGLQKEDIRSVNISHPAKILEALRFKADAFLGLAKEEHNLKNREQALDTYQKAAELVTELQRSYRFEPEKYTLRKQTTDIYQNGFRTAYKLYRDTGNDAFKRRAFLLAEKSRYRILLKNLQERNARNFANIPAFLIEKEYSLRNRITNLHQQVSNFRIKDITEDSIRLRNLKISLSHATDSLDAHIKKLEGDYPRYYDLKYEVITTEPQVIRKNIVHRKHTILQYFFGTKSVYAFVISKRHFGLYRLHTVSGLASKIEKYRTALQESASVKEFTEISNHLYEILIKPIADKLQTQKLIIIPDDRLYYIPFESLTRNDFSNSPEKSFKKLPYLVRDFEINYAPSISFLELVKRYKSRGNNKKKFLGFAPKFNSFSESQKRSIDDLGNAKLSSLPFSCKEVEKVGQIVSRRRGIWSILSGYNPEVTTFLDTLATEEKFKSLNLTEYEFIHIATHAYVTGGKDSQAGIFFADSDNDKEDGILRVPEIYNLNLDARLLTLSACKTGIGYFAEGEGITGLSRAFQYAGARNLLVSLWNVDDRATYRLMTAFYRLHHNKHNFTSALRDAKIQLIKSDKFAHPKFWASFILVGP